MGAEPTVVRGDDTAEALSTEAVRVGTIPQVVAGYIAIDTIDEAYRGVVRPRVDVVVIPGARHPVYVSLSGEAQSFIHG